MSGPSCTRRVPAGSVVWRRSWRTGGEHAGSSPCGDPVSTLKHWGRSGSPGPRPQRPPHRGYGTEVGLGSPCPTSPVRGIGRRTRWCRRPSPGGLRVVLVDSEGLPSPPNTSGVPPAHPTPRLEPRRGWGFERVGPGPLSQSEVQRSPLVTTPPHRRPIGQGRGEEDQGVGVSIRERRRSVLSGLLGDKGPRRAVGVATTPFYTYRGVGFHLRRHTRGGLGFPVREKTCGCGTNRHQGVEARP